VALLGFLLLLTGFIMNIQVLRSPLRSRVPAAEFIRSWPWLISVALIAAGVLLLVLARA
jgi:hypothetical protein